MDNRITQIYNILRTYQDLLNNRNADPGTAPDKANPKDRVSISDKGRKIMESEDFGLRTSQGSKDKKGKVALPGVKPSHEIRNDPIEEQ